MAGKASDTVLQEWVDYRTLPNNTNKNWWLDPGLRWNIFYCIGLCGTLFFNGYDGSLFNGLQAIEAWQTYFDNPSSTILGLMNSAGYLPGILASPTSDQFAYYFGHRASVWVGSVFVIGGAILMSRSTSTGKFCGGRVIMGFGTSFVLTVAPSLLQEIAHPRLRAQMGAFYTGVYYNSAVISASTCLGCLNLGLADSLLCTACRARCYAVDYMHHTRWLASRGKIDQARQVLVTYHANGKEDDELVAYELDEIQEALKFEKEGNTIRYVDFFKGRGNLHRLAINVIVAVGTNWVGNGIVSYYLSPILTSLGIGSASIQLKVLIGLQSWNLIIACTAAVFVERVGRRPLWLISTAGMLMAFTCVMGFSSAYETKGTLSMGIAAIPFLFLFYGSYSIAWTPLAYSYPVDILPFSLRTKGQAIYISTQTLAVSVNTWVNPVALAAIEWRYYAVYIAILLTMIVLIWFLFPETKGLTIEEIGMIFDKNSTVGGVAARTGNDEEAEVRSIFNDEAMDKN
ncbi:hexose transporter protein [Aspergillus ellipticus CBS 707.79]|uniref:Hexose transporter protein n=1 Tax=Aspergillus ellipticus CBS 707.79 TaxID=1448320 RepID=A0A319D643_9EURO|nr:hexose transporter protein [Aspergillus ellipticus CBS 707.79]